MRKATCLVVVCLFVSVLALASGALAISKAKIVNTEWEATGSGKFKDPSTGDYLGAMVGGIGIVKITDTEVIATFAPMVASGLFGPGVATVLAGATASWTMDAYLKAGDILTSSTGSVEVTDPTGQTIVFYSGTMTSKITFITQTSFKGKIKYTDDSGDLNVIKIAGKKLGQLTVQE